MFDGEPFGSRIRVELYLINLEYPLLLPAINIYVILGATCGRNSLGLMTRWGIVREAAIRFWGEPFGTMILGPSRV